MRIAAYQMDIAWEDRERNYEKAKAAARRAKEQGADVFVLPEMFALGFSLNPAVTAESEDGPTARFLRDLAVELELNVLGGVVLHGTEGRGRNTALAYSRRGALLARYVKVHLFSFAREDAHHEPGDGPVTFELDGARCACTICYDLRFPELWRSTAQATSIAFVIASWPKTRQRHWDLLLPARAVENQQFVVGVNRVGQGGGLEYTGGSAIWSPLGERLAFGEESEGIVLAEVDPNEVIRVRKTMPFLQDRRIF
ncbi:MAG: carbon-nitrogen family hydrolase [Myxococcota bacterium]|jgi:predicted amidohydrolase|nr:carbon-nitrogen family hydrolase [Myxococcota bacterium]